MPTYKKLVPRTPPFVAYTVGDQYAQLVENLKRTGNAVHNALVDERFAGQPDTREDAKVQVPPDLSPCADHAAAILRANAIRPYLINHLEDGTYAHKAADTANAAIIVAPDATDVPTLTALLVQYRTALNQHFVNSVVHNRIFIASSIVTVPVDAATNLQVMNTLLLVLEQHLYSAAVSLEITGT
jgi:hypothetical protein